MADEPSNEPPIVPPVAEPGAVDDWDHAVARSQNGPSERMARLRSQLATRRVVGDGQPADAGLSGLGLIMQLGGGGFFCLNIVAAIAGLITPAPSVLALAGVIGAVRSSIHFRAGLELSRGRIDGLRPLRRYLIAAGVHTAAAVALLVAAEPGLSIIVLGAVALLAWPLILAAFWMRPSVRAVGELSQNRPDPILPEDRGIQGLAALMSIMGLTGLIGVSFAAIMLIFLTEETGVMRAQVPITIYLLIAALLGRSIVHTTGGLLLLRNPDPDRLHRMASRYFTASVLSTVALVIHMFYATPNIVIIIPMLPLAALMMLWPIIMRSYTDAVIPDLVWEPTGPAITLSPDGGLSTIAAFLLGGLAISIVQTATTFIPDLGKTAGAMGEETSGWLVGLSAALTIWVCYEFLAGDKRAKLAAMAYAAVTVGTSIYALSIVWGSLPGMRSVLGPIQMLLFVPLVIPLIAPIITLVAAFGPRPERVVKPAVFD